VVLSRNSEIPESRGNRASNDRHCRGRNVVSSIQDSNRDVGATREINLDSHEAGARHVYHVDSKPMEQNRDSSAGGTYVKLREPGTDEVDNSEAKRSKPKPPIPPLASRPKMNVSGDFTSWNKQRIVAAEGREAEEHIYENEQVIKQAIFGVDHDLGVSGKSTGASANDFHALGDSLGASGKNVDLSKKDTGTTKDTMTSVIPKHEDLGAVGKDVPRTMSFDSTEAFAGSLEHIDTPIEEVENDLEKDIHSILQPPNFQIDSLDISPSNATLTLQAPIPDWDSSLSGLSAITTTSNVTFSNDHTPTSHLGSSTDVVILEEMTGDNEVFEEDTAVTEVSETASSADSDLTPRLQVKTQNAFNYDDAPETFTGDKIGAKVNSDVTSANVADETLHKCDVTVRSEARDSEKKDNKLKRMLTGQGQTEAVTLVPVALQGSVDRQLSEENPTTGTLPYGYRKSFDPIHGFPITSKAAEGATASFDAEEEAPPLPAKTTSPSGNIARALTFPHSSDVSMQGAVENKMYMYGLPKSPEESPSFTSSVDNKTYFLSYSQPVSTVEPSKAKKLPPGKETSKEYTLEMAMSQQLPKDRIMQSSGQTCPISNQRALHQRRVTDPAIRSIGSSEFQKLRNSPERAESQRISMKEKALPRQSGMNRSRASKDSNLDSHLVELTAVQDLLKQQELESHLVHPKVRRDFIQNLELKKCETEKRPAGRLNDDCFTVQDSQSQTEEKPPEIIPVVKSSVMHPPRKGGMRYTPPRKESLDYSDPEDVDNSQPTPNSYRGLGGQAVNGLAAHLSLNIPSRQLRETNIDSSEIPPPLPPKTKTPPGAKGDQMRKRVDDGRRLTKYPADCDKNLVERTQSFNIEGRPDVVKTRRTSEGAVGHHNQGRFSVPQSIMALAHMHHTASNDLYMNSESRAMHRSSMPPSALDAQEPTFKLESKESSTQDDIDHSPPKKASSAGPDDREQTRQHIHQHLQMWHQKQQRRKVPTDGSECNTPLEVRKK
jgi:hypothetical protein